MLIIICIVTKCRLSITVTYLNIIRPTTYRSRIPRVRCICSVKVNLHTVIRSGENAILFMVKKLLREYRDFNHGTSTGILSTELIIVIYSVHTLKQSIVYCATILTKCIISKISIVKYFKGDVKVTSRRTCNCAYSDTPFI